MSFASELRFAIRRLRNAPAFATATIAMLAVGIALAVGMFSVVRGVVLGSLPFPDSDRVLVVNADNPTQQVEASALTPAEAVRLREADVFDEVGYYTWGGLSVYDGEHPREFSLAIVSDGFFQTLAVRPMLGRWFSTDDFASQSDAVVLSHAEWQRLLGGDVDAIGRRIDTSDGPMRVIGVMPPAFAVPSADVGAWRPWQVTRLRADQPWFWNARFVSAVARLPSDATSASAERLSALMAAVRTEHSLPDDGWRLQATPMLDSIVGDVRNVLWGAFGLALLVLLIGCANVAIMLDARQVAGRHEQAVTQALGASRARLYRGLLLEIGLLGIAAVGLGVLLAMVGIDGLRELARGSVPRVEMIGVDGVVLALAMALGLLLPFLSAVAGALRLRGMPADAIRGGGRGMVGSGEHPRQLLPALGIALSTVSLVAASALLMSLWQMQQVDPGYRTDRVHAMMLYRDGGIEDWQELSDPLLERLRAMPGVEQVAMTTHAPLGPHGSFNIDLRVRGRDAPEPFQASLRRVTPGYLELLGIPLLGGRGIEPSDDAGTEPVAVINRELARRTFGDASPLGQMIGLPIGQGERIQHRVVGVMADIHNAGLRVAPAPELLVPYAQSPAASMTFLVRAAIDMPGIERQMSDALWQIDPREAITQLFALQQPLDAQLQPTRFFVRTVGAFAIAALLLAAFGVYAVASLQQQRRLAEFGLRRAVGAHPLRLATQVLRECLRSTALGVGLGAALGWISLNLLQSQLFGVGTSQPLVIGFGVLLLVLAALSAALVPALRASRVDPLQALRHP